jgi:hypothetical protein
MEDVPLLLEHFNQRFATLGKKPKIRAQRDRGHAKLFSRATCAGKTIERARDHAHNHRVGLKTFRGEAEPPASSYRFPSLRKPATPIIASLFSGAGPRQMETSRARLS